MPGINVSLNACLAKHMHTLCDDDILLPLMTHIAAQQSPQALQLFCCLVSQTIFACRLTCLVQLTVHRLHKPTTCEAQITYDVESPRMPHRSVVDLQFRARLLSHTPAYKAQSASQWLKDVCKMLSCKSHLVVFLNALPLVPFPAQLLALRVQSSRLVSCLAL